jgi:hypothetical protein
MSERQSKAEARLMVVNAVSMFMAKLTTTNEPGATLVTGDLDRAFDAFESAVIAETLQPRDPPPELAAAEAFLRNLTPTHVGSLYRIGVPVVAELDRLRAENAALRGEAERTVYVSATNAEEALRMSKRNAGTNDLTYEVRISTRRIDGGAK